MADFLAQLIGQVFGIGIQIAMPVILVSLLLQLGMGILNRQMPNLQIFFIA